MKHDFTQYHGGELEVAVSKYYKIPSTIDRTSMQFVEENLKPEIYNPIIKKVRHSSEHLEKGLKKLKKFKVYPSSCNFFFSLLEL